MKITPELTFVVEAFVFIILIMFTYVLNSWLAKLYKFGAVSKFDFVTVNIMLLIISLLFVFVFVYFGIVVAGLQEGLKWKI